MSVDLKRLKRQRDTVQATFERYGGDENDFEQTVRLPDLKNLVAALERAEKDRLVLDRLVGLLRETRDSSVSVAEFWRNDVVHVCLNPTVRHRPPVGVGKGGPELTPCGKCDHCLAVTVDRRRLGDVVLPAGGER